MGVVAPSEICGVGLTGLSRQGNGDAVGVGEVIARVDPELNLVPKASTEYVPFLDPRPVAGGNAFKQKVARQGLIDYLC